MLDSKIQGTALPPRLDVIETLAAQIPNSLWAVWRLVPRDDGKPGKVPYRPDKQKHQQNIGHDSPAQWVDFKTACQWHEAGVGASGLGILIGSNPKDNPSVKYSSSLVALDIDGCLGTDGELLEATGSDVRAAVKALHAAGVYIEISPSGTGLRALWRGSRPDGVGERWESFGTSGELYDGKSSRFVTVTGEVWHGGPIAIMEPGEALAAEIAEYLGMFPNQRTEDGGAPARDMPTLSDAEIIAKVKQGGGHGKGKRLWEADLSDYAGDNSAADRAICCLIAQWTDDAAQVVRVWGASALGMREKFKRKDYQTKTVQGALYLVRKSAAEKSSAGAGKAERLKAAIAAGDGADGALASALASWGGKVPSTLEAAERILSLDKRLAGAFALDDFSGQVLKLRSLRECLAEIAPEDGEPKLGQTWADSDDATIAVWLGRVWGISLHTVAVKEALDHAARRRRINTVVDSLNGLVWDGKPRLALMLVKFFNADDSHDTPRYLSAIGRCFMIGAVARAFEPGVKVDHVLTLEGGQGFGKSRAIRVLAESVAPHAFKEGLPPLTLGSEAERAVAGAWIIELSELAFMNKAETEAVKAFLTKQEDSVRHPHARRYTLVKRTVSFAATTNQATFVRDATGARRFWTFRVSRQIDIEALRSIAPQLWAEAVSLYKAGEPWHLTDASALKDAEASQWLRLDRDGFDEVIAEKLIDPLTAGKLGELSDFYMQALDVYRLVMPEAEAEFSRNARSFSEAMARSGFEKKTSGGRSMWRVGAALIARIYQARAM